MGTKRTRRKKKITMFLSTFCLLFCMICTNVYAEHTHSGECYINATQHICDGNETTFGSCFSMQIAHEHNSSCYEKTCNGGDFDIVHTFIKKCEKCNCDYNSMKLTCLKCGATNTFEDCTNSSCANTSMPNFDKQMPHLELDEEKAINQRVVICGKADGEIVGYERTCSLQNGAYYDENNHIANPKCNIIIKSYKPQIENSTIDSFSNLVVVEYLDGTTDTITGHSLFEGLDKTISYENHPIEIYFTGFFVGNDMETEQFVTSYFTNIVETNDIADTVKDGEFETVETIITKDVVEKNEETEEEIKIETIISDTKDEETKEEIVQAEEKEEIKEEVKENSLNESTIILATAIIIAILIFTFALINFFIKKRS